MNLLFDYEIFHSQRYGGISRYFVELIRALAGRPGLRITIAAGLYQNELLPSLRGLPGVRVLGWKRPAWLPGRRIYGLFNLLFFELAARAVRPDLYHATYYRNLARGLRAGRVVTIHDLIHEFFPATPGDPTAARKRQAIAHADLLLCVSAHTRDDLVRHYHVPPEKTRVVHHGVRRAVIPRPARPLEAPYLLHVGDRGGYKNGLALLRVLAREPDLRDRFQVVYFGSGPFNPAEKQLMKEAGLQGRVHHATGSDEDLATWYAHAFALVYPSRYEGFGFPPLEAMQYGCPVLASNQSSLPEVVGEAGRLFHPDSETSLADALRGLVDNPKGRADLVSRGQQHHQRFTWKECADRTMAAYASLMPPPARHE